MIKFNLKQKIKQILKDKDKTKKIGISTVCIFVCLAIILPILIVSLNSFDRFVNSNSKGITSYDITATLNEDMTLNAEQTVNYKNSNDVIFNELYFHLYPNSFSATAVNKPVSTINESKAYPNGKSYGGIEISSVKIANNNAVYSVIGEDDHMLKIELNDQLYPNDWVKLSFEYKVTLPNINHRFGYGDNAINLANFYPVASIFENGEFNQDAYNYNGDPFYSTISNYNVSLTYNSNLVLASTGNVCSNNTNNETTTSTMNAKAVRDFAMVLSSKFNLLTKQIGNTQIKYYYYNDENPEDSLQTSEDALTTFNNLFTTYPYRTLCVVETNFIFGGMEYPNLVMISDNLDNYEDYTNTIVHEIAHQWWYGLVGNNEFSYGWLDEGLAEYSTLLFYENNLQYNKNTDEIVANARNSYVLFIDVYTDVFGTVDTSMNRKLNEYPTEPEYVYIAYVKGMLMYDNLKQIIGEKKLIKCLKNYCVKNMGKIVTPDDLIASFEKTCFTNLESFFDSWINGTVVIESLSNTDK